MAVASTSLTLKEVENELREVAEWHSLGIQLGVESEQLDIIEGSYNGSGRRKAEVIKFWLRNSENPSWGELAGAICGMGKHRRLAVSLRMKATGRQLQGDHQQVSSCTTISPATNGHNLNPTISGNAYSVSSMEDFFPGCRGIKLDELDLQTWTRDLRADFNVLLTLVQQTLECKGIEVRTFVMFLKRIPAYQANQKSLFEAVLPELYEQKDLTGVFDIIANYCSWFNHSLLGDIIRAFCADDPHVRKERDDFIEEVRKYCRHRICECGKSLKNGFGFRRKKDVTHITLKVDREWSTIQVEQLEEVTVNLAKVLKVQRHTLYLLSAEKGCVKLEFLVPVFVAEESFPLSAEQEAALMSFHVEQLVCSVYYQFLKPKSKHEGKGLTSSTHQLSKKSESHLHETEGLTSSTHPLSKKSESHLHETEGLTSSTHPLSKKSESHLHETEGLTSSTHPFSKKSESHLHEIVSEGLTSSVHQLSKEGVLQLCRKNWLKRKTWKPYLFEVTSTSFQFLKHGDNVPKPSQQVPLVQVTAVIPFPSKGTKFPFEVHFKGEGSPWMLRANSETDRHHWMNAILPGSSAVIGSSDSWKFNVYHRHPAQKMTVVHNPMIDDPEQPLQHPNEQPELEHQPQVPPHQPQGPPHQPQVPQCPQVPPRQPQVPPRQPQVPLRQPQVPPRQPQVPPRQSQVPPRQPQGPPYQPQVPNSRRNQLFRQYERIPAVVYENHQVEKITLPINSDASEVGQQNRGVGSRLSVISQRAIDGSRALLAQPPY